MRLPRLLLFLTCCAGLTCLAGRPAPADDNSAKPTAELRELAKKSPRAALNKARAADPSKAADNKLLAELDAALDTHITDRLKKPCKVQFDPVKSGFESLSEQERIEQLRDWALLAAYKQMDPDADTARLTLGTRAVSRLTPSNLLELEYGPGRIAAVDNSEYLVVVPGGKEAGEFDWPTATRLLDERRSMDGRLPPRMRLVTYEIVRNAKSDAPEGVSIVLLDTTSAERLKTKTLSAVPGEIFWTKEFGFVTATVANRADLKAALEQIDDLISLTFKDKVVVEGRKYPAVGQLKAHRIDLADLAVIAQSNASLTKLPKKFAAKLAETPTYKKLSVADQWTARVVLRQIVLQAAPKLVQEWEDLEQNEFDEVIAVTLTQGQLKFGGEQINGIGFSLDPWIDATKTLPGVRGEKPAQPKTLAEEFHAAGKLLVETDDEEAQEIGKRLIDVAKTVAEAKTFRMPNFRADDQTGLFALLDDLRKKGKNLTRAADLMEQLLQKYQFQAPRYEGNTAGTEVGMTMYYTDLAAKLFALRSVFVNGKVTPVPLPHGPDFPFLSIPDVRYAAFHTAEVKRLGKGRLWFAPKRSALTISTAKDSTTMSFAPIGVTLFMKSRENQTADEVDANIQYQLFTRSWNSHFQEIANAEPEFARLNQLMKWSAALLFAEKQERTPFAFLAKETPPTAKLRFADWYVKAGKNKGVGVKIALPFRKKVADEPADALETITSDHFNPGGHWIGDFRLKGGETGATSDDLRVRTFPKEVKRPLGLPSNVRPAVHRDVDLRQGGSSVREDGTKVTWKNEQDALHIVGLPGRTSFRLPAVELRDSGKAPELQRDVMVGTLDSPLVVESRYGVQNVPNGAASVTISHAEQQIIRLDVTVAPHEEAQLLMDRVGRGLPFDKLAGEVRYDEENAQLLVKLPGENGWLAIEEGEDGAAAIRYGAPGQPTVYRSSFVPPPGNETVKMTGPSFTRLPLGQGAEGNRSAWLPPGGSYHWDVSGFEGKGRLYLAPEEDVFYHSATGELGKKLSNLKAVDRDRLADALQPSDNGELLEIMLNEGNTVLRRGESGWILGDSKAPETLLGSGGNGKGPPPPPVSAVYATGDADGRKGVGSIRLLQEGILQVPRDLPPAQRKRVREIIAFLADNPEVVKPAHYLTDLTVEKLATLKKKWTALKEAPAASVQKVANDFVIQIGDATLNLGDALQAVRQDKPLPKEWMALKGKALRINYQNVEAVDFPILAQQLKALAPLLEKMEIVPIFDTGLPGSRERAQQLLNWRNARLEVDSKTLKSVSGGGKAVNELLHGFELPYAEGRQVEIRLGHADGDFYDRQIKEAESGAFAGKHVAFLVCADHPLQVQRLIQAALTNKAASVTVSGKQINVKAAGLALVELKLNPTLKDASTSIEMIRLGYEGAEQRLQRCADAADPRAQFYKEFGTMAPKVEQLFNKLDKAEFEKTIKNFRTDRLGLLLLVELTPSAAQEALPSAKIVEVRSAA